MITPGTYQHYKGKQYRVIGIGKLEATMEDVVIYQPLYPCEFTYFVRPLAEFTSSVDTPNGTVPRFKQVA